MKNGHWMTAKDVLRVNAFKWPNKIGAKDLYKEYTFAQWNERSCRLANALAGMGMKKGDRFAALAYNCVEWMEIYAAAAKGGFICVPIMFRLVGPLRWNTTSTTARQRSLSSRAERTLPMERNSRGSRW